MLEWTSNQWIGGNYLGKQGNRAGACLLVFPKQTVCQHGSKERTEITEHVECVVDCCGSIIIHLQHLRQVYNKYGYREQASRKCIRLLKRLLSVT